MASARSSRARSLFFLALLRVAALAACCCAAAADNQFAQNVSVDTLVRTPVNVELPVVIGPGGDVLDASVNASTLRYGNLTMVNEWRFTYTPNPAAVPKNGTTDTCQYTLRDNAGFSEEALIVVNIGANTKPTASNVGASTNANTPTVIGIESLAFDSDRDPLTIVRLGTPKYGNATKNSTHVIYKPVAALVPIAGARDAFSFTVTDNITDGGASAVIEITLSPNQDPWASMIFFTVNMNNSVAINLTEAARDDDGDPITFALTPNPPVLKYGSITRTGNGLYVYKANPGVSQENLQDVFAYSVHDGRGGNASSEVTVTIVANAPPYISGPQQVSTLSTESVIIAPMLQASESYDGDSKDFCIVSMDSPKYGSVSVVGVNTRGNDYFSYRGRNVTDYRYTPYANITTNMVDIFNYTVSDLRGGFTTGEVQVSIYAYPNCIGTVEGVAVPGIVAPTFDNTGLSECGGVTNFTNCFNGNVGPITNGACRGSEAFSTADAYNENTTYYTCLLLSRKLPCHSTSDPTLVGFTTWQSLGTALCSAECEAYTKGYSLPGSTLVDGYDCEACMKCENNQCPDTPNGPAAPPEVCCIINDTDLGSPSPSPSPEPSPSPSPEPSPEPSPSPSPSPEPSPSPSPEPSPSPNATDPSPSPSPAPSPSPPPSPPPIDYPMPTAKEGCGSCVGLPSMLVCGSDGNTYASPCVASCQGVQLVDTNSPCQDDAGSVLLDPASAFAIDPAEVKRLSLEGLTVLGAALTALAGEDTEGGDAGEFSVEAVGGVGTAPHSQQATTPPRPWLDVRRTYFQAMRIQKASEDSTFVAVHKPKKKGVLVQVDRVFKAAQAIQQVDQSSQGLSMGSVGEKTQLKYPYFAIGMLALKGADGSLSRFCTGFVVQKGSAGQGGGAVVITAGHCLYNTTSGKVKHPKNIRFLPQVINGAMSNAEAEIGVVHYTIPAWYIGLGRFGKLPATQRPQPAEYAKWDIAVMKLDRPLLCKPDSTDSPSKVKIHCTMGLGALVSSGYTDDFTTVGYGAPRDSASSADELRLYEADCKVKDARHDTGYLLSSCRMTHGMSGGPFFPSGKPFWLDPFMKELPNGVRADLWPALGVNHAITSRYSVAAQLTRAHLLWIYYAGASKAVYYMCNSLDNGRITTCDLYKPGGKQA